MPGTCASLVLSSLFRCLDLCLNFFDLPVRLLEMIKRSLNKLAERARQWVVVFDQFWNPLGDVANTAGTIRPNSPKTRRSDCGLGGARFH
jgi:hypothetical protein